MTSRPIMHIDIPIPNRVATAAFYATLFGWEVRHDTFPYTWFSTANISGGFSDLHEGLVPVREILRAGDVVLYFPSEDIEADLRQIEALGGTVLLHKTQAGEGHYVALFTDPNGVRLGLAGAK
jgi:predicted enzyme related to lactoylglutathione lyase